MRTFRRVELAILLIPVVVMVGCGSIEGSALSGVWKIRDTGITLSPPGTLTPTISSVAAYGRCLSGAAACGPGSPTAVQLALATDTGSGELDVNGNLHLTLDDTLVWAITWLGIPCPPHSGGPFVEPNPSASSAPVATASALCDEVAFVDARTGKFYFTYSGPH